MLLNNELTRFGLDHSLRLPSAVSVALSFLVLSVNAGRSLPTEVCTVTDLLSV